MNERMYPILKGFKQNLFTLADFDCEVGKMQTDCFIHLGVLREKTKPRLTVISELVP